MKINKFQEVHQALNMTHNLKNAMRTLIIVNWYYQLTSKIH
ncbi:hypothetical protein PULV_a0404 [Pseudoalteromonas ulvae UL12]|nr:hypothetical protein [Pseudoalteromonas ulvae UL12]